LNYPRASNSTTDCTRFQAECTLLQADCTSGQTECTSLQTERRFSKSLWQFPKSPKCQRNTHPVYAVPFLNAVPFLQGTPFAFFPDRFLALLLLVLHLCLPNYGFATSTIAQEESQAPSQPFDSDQTADASPHPWIETAPPAFARLIELGRVQIKIDDKRLDIARKQALTHFKIKADYRYLYTQQSTRVDPKNDGGYVAKINARITVPEIEILHDISIRSGFNPRDPWKSPLMKHEFDHVSISTDPRLLKLLKKILNRKISIDVRWNSDERFSDELVSRAIKAEINTQIAELERVVQANYDRLDRETRDGTMDAKDREALFTTMYDIDSLRALNFLYLDAAKSIVQDSRDKDVLEHYSLMAPP